ncbi:hypothetical protein Xbed_03604 [Xenorhabdus beddingii]|uniref:Uncharacterized protein n=1 Tax=Xenorhabdus beddingii TaxID=40578 RepID=A0A1Y2SCQ5_9GAMM|nr:hypothetical protein Xbed_03604 [Xenorhabdus beddingii]
MDRFGLFAGFVDGQHQTTVQQLFIHINGGGGEHQHHRAFDGVAFGDQIARRLILAGARHRQLAVRLQQLQRIGGLPYPFFFGDGEDFMLEISFTQIEQALPGHGAVLNAFFCRYQAQYRIHQGRFSRRAAALDQDG